MSQAGGLRLKTFLLSPWEVQACGRDTWGLDLSPVPPPAQPALCGAMGVSSNTNGFAAKDDEEIFHVVMVIPLL